MPRPRSSEDDTDRQDALADLLMQAEQMPGVVDAMRAYESLERAMWWRVVNARAGLRYATGGNAQ